MYTGSEEIIASGKNASAGHEPANAFDGVYLTYTPAAVWASQRTYNGWLGLRWALPKTIREIRIGPRFGVGTTQLIDTFYIEKQLQDGSWERVADHTCQGTGWTEGSMRTFDARPNIVVAESVSMSSTYVYSPVPTVDLLTNQNYDSTNTPWYSTDPGTNQWIKADLGSSKRVDNIIIGYSYSPYTGWYGIALNGCVLQWSDDDSTWTTAYTISGLTATTSELIAPTGGVTARYWRILKAASGYLAVAQFRFTVNP